MTHEHKASTEMLLKIGGNVILALFWLLFVYKALVGYGQSHKPSLLLLSLATSLVVLLFVFRTPAKGTSPHILDWGIAFCGTFLATLLYPTDSPMSDIGELTTAVGTLLTILALLSLNRSFGIVPAERSIKTAGMYAFVRHPIYASYIITFIGYLIANQSLYNLAIFVSWLTFEILRLYREEAFLKENEEYQNYKKNVPWRLVPFVY